MEAGHLHSQDFRDIVYNPVNRYLGPRSAMADGCDCPPGSRLRSLQLKALLNKGNLYQKRILLHKLIAFFTRNAIIKYERNLKIAHIG